MSCKNKVFLKNPISLERWNINKIQFYGREGDKVRTDRRRDDKNSNAELDIHYIQFLKMHPRA
jgi:hypothetical protein